METAWRWYWWPRRATVTGDQQVKPAWKANLLVIGSLIGIMLAYFYWQMRYGEQTFRRHVLDHAQMVGEIIKLNISREVLSREVVEEVITTVLGNAARFVDYLDGVEPFSPEELAAFSEEAGLAGIRVQHRDGLWVEGPSGWLKTTVPCPQESLLTSIGEEKLYTLAIPRIQKDTCIIVGMANKRIAALREQISLSRLLAILPGLAGISYVRFEDILINQQDPYSRPSVAFSGKGKDMVAEGRLPMDGKMLVVGIEARHFGERMHQLRIELITFSVIVGILGGVFTWLLYRYQGTYLNQVRRYERRLAREQEDAALGRASATITHEIRNPLNAISMGLQRLEIEATGLSHEQKSLLATLRQAVSRTDGIIKELRRYVRPIVPKDDLILLSDILKHILSLYRRACQERDISLKTQLESKGAVLGDRGLLEEVVENLIKNAMEASPKGGEIYIRLFAVQGRVELSMQNHGFELDESQVHEIMEPYFTTKTQGSGLGLSIAHRIIRAHGGQMMVAAPMPGCLKVSFELPLASEDTPKG